MVASAGAECFGRETGYEMPPSEPPHPLPPALQGALDAHRRGDLEGAARLYGAILATAPGHVEARHLLAIVRAQQGRHEEAIAAIEAVLRNHPNSAAAHYTLARSWHALGDVDRAIPSYRAALALQPDFTDARLNIGTILEALGRHEEAIASYRDVLALDPAHAVANYNLGNVLLRLNRHADAIARYRSALAADPVLVEAHNNLGNALAALDRYDDALACYRAALALKPDYVEAHNNLANSLEQLGRIDEAIASYRKSFEIDPGQDHGRSASIMLRRRMCDWDGLASEEKALTQPHAAGTTPALPFVLSLIADDPARHLEAAHAFLRHAKIEALPPMFQGRPYRHDKIRVAYLSADFREHVVATQIAGLIEDHDRAQFEISAVSFGPERADPMRARLIRAFDRFVDVRSESDADAARKIAGLEIDIAVDLMGYTRGCRPGILAHRPAPIQVGYLGYPGTSGAGFMDYVLADAYALPSDRQRFFSERIVHLPGCFLVNDLKRLAAETAETPTRRACGLPAHGFVFCSFNNSAKIAPEFFAVWMRLLAAVPGSVLWLSADHDRARENLRRQAAALGIAPERLVFAQRLDRLADHIARLGLADLFLDTLPYNAHTTASDALWAGVPLVTCSGNAFAGRVAGSLLRAVGLDDLVTENRADYEALALKLATHPALLAKWRAKLKRNRITAALFDPGRMRRSIEAAYREMWNIWQRGEAPHPFSVADEKPKRARGAQPSLARQPKKPARS